MHFDLTSDLIKKYWERVDVRGADECWPWIGAVTHHGYGQFKAQGKALRSTHIAHAIDRGHVPDGLVVAHSCDNPGCQNPRHLKAMTQLQNIADRNAKKRQDHGDNAPRYTPPPPRGQVRGDRCARTKLTETQVREIRAMYVKGKRGFGYSSIARKYGVADFAIEMIVKRRSWIHIN